MVKFKHTIVKKNLSWEQKKVNNICDYAECTEIGVHKAPKSRSNIKNYYFFCLKHVQEYNKSWDFYKGLSVDQIELSMRKDTVWNRPSWPLSGSPDKIMGQLNEFFNNDYSLFEKHNDFEDFVDNKILKENLSNEEKRSVELLEISLPLSVEDIKKAYKRLVKIFHPDVNRSNKQAEKKFKEINEAYKILLKKFLKK
tara:strand:+ start:173 stop:763 length:591 start_codon:yes stop_codon:yes gene_type:complete